VRIQKSVHHNPLLAQARFLKETLATRTLDSGVFPMVVDLTDESALAVASRRACDNLSDLNGPDAVAFVLPLKEPDKQKPQTFG
jgi:hypothetical protein